VREHCREPCRLTDEQLRSLILTDTLRPDTVRLADDSRTRSILSAQEDRERSRALNGLVLRQKVYALGDYDSAHGEGLRWLSDNANSTMELLQPLRRKWRPTTASVLSEIT
jgi:hypothetical protein